MRKLLFVGPVLTASGYGVHARQLLGALVNAGQFDICVESLRWGETGFLQDDDLQWIRDLAAKNRDPDQQYDVAVHVTIPNEFKRRAPLTIGVTAGIEVDRVSPQWILKCNAEVDLVIVPSEHSRNAFMVEYEANTGEKLRLEKPIFTLAEGVDTSVYFPREAFSTSGSLLDEMGVSKGSKNFICVGLGLDKPSGRDRKNITSLVEWFCKTFKGNKNVGLVLKTSIVNGSTVDFEVTKKRIADIKSAAVGDDEFPSIHLVHGRVDDSSLAGMYNDPRIIAMISPTHGEGFGLPLLEAAACGLPVIATDWSGHIDFLTKDGKKLFVPIEYDLEQIYKECVWEGVMEAGTKWAVPRESDACIKMQKMVLSSETPRKWASELALHIEERYSFEATGKPFADLVAQAVQEVVSTKPSTRDDFVKALRAKVKSLGSALIYTMPMSAGDVFLSTGVISALRNKHPGHRVYFATAGQYFDIISDLPDGDGMLIDEVIEWQPWMQDIGLLEDVFDEVYTPNLAVQMIHSNWVHRGNGRNLIDEFAVQCGVVADRPRTHGSPRWGAAAKTEKDVVVAVHAGGQKSARSYAYWSDVVKNLRANSIKVKQFGASDDIAIGAVDFDLRGKVSHKDLPRLLASCDAFVGIDSYPMHVASVVGTPVVAIFGSSYANSTGPKGKRSFNLTLLETEDRNGCERACYKDTCKIDASNPCINNINPESIVGAVSDALPGPDALRYEEYSPKLAGYTHILNPKTHGYPYAQSIMSMLGFCDEIIVVDGGSTDGSISDLQNFPVIEAAITSGRLKVIDRDWDPEEPGMDGMQKAFGRAMVSHDMEFLWQQDADEIVHEDDYEKIKDICKRFPPDVDVLHLPVIELWGDDETCRTDRHSWKWRLSRNNMRVTHGINQAARQMDPKTGRFFAKEGMSDGCEMIDIVTGEHLPHRGFYTNEIESARKRNPEEYGRMMNRTFSQLPSVWHYSWADLPRKIKNFRDFWDNQWHVLYQAQSQPRFPGVTTDEDVMAKAEELKNQGGEHGAAATFKLEKSPPKVMR